MNKETWNVLLNYESKTIVQRAYLKTSSQNRPLNKEAASEISSIITQARKYFASASEADLIIKPLLIYYGVLGLARGLIIFSSFKRREANLDPRHGLTAVGWANNLAADTGSIENLAIRLDTCGTFRELISAVSNETLIRFNSSEVQWRASHRDFEGKHYELNFGDLLVRTPAISHFVNRWIAGPNRFVRIHSVNGTSTDELRVCVYCPQNTRPMLPDIFGSSKWEEESIEGDFINIKITQPAPCFWSEMHSHFLGVGDAYIVQDFGGVQLCQIASIFIMSYVVGMLARYHPSHWMALARNQRHDAALPTIQALVDHIENRCPAMILDFLQYDPPVVAG